MSTKAKESAQVKKYRRKLQKQMEEETELVNNNALKKAKDSMQQWISRNSNNRINLRDKTFSLFDENRHPAPTESKFVLQLFDDLRHETESEQRSLKGRVSPTHQAPPKTDSEGQ